MNDKYINIYNNLVNLTRNINLYKDFRTQDTFSDRLILFLLHFAFFLKTFKKKNNKKILQEIFDFIFKQLELSIREMGYGDITINKKMKNYLNVFYSILDKIENWDDLSHSNKSKILLENLNIKNETSELLNYFDNYRLNLSNNTLNSYIKGVIKTEN